MIARKGGESYFSVFLILAHLMLLSLVGLASWGHSDRHISNILCRIYGGIGIYRSHTTID